MAESTTIPQAALQGKPANKQIKFIIGGLVVAAMIIYLIVSAIGSTGAYYREVHEVKAQEASLIGKQVRVSGLIVQETVQWDSANLDLSFEIEDQTGTGDVLAVHYHGVKPDNFERPGSSAIVEGKLRSDGVLEAKDLLLKCPSRYEEAPEEIRNQATGTGG